MKNDIYNALRAVLLILIFAIGAAWCVTEKSLSAELNQTDPAEQPVEALQVEELPTIDVAEQIRSVETKMAKVRAAVVEAAPIEEEPQEPAAEPEPIPETVPELEPAEEPAPEAEPTPEESLAVEPTIRYALTDEERKIVEAVVAAEAGGEDFDGQCLVAQCILNTAEAKGMRPDDVVLAPKQYTTPNYDRRSLVEDAVSAVFDEGYTVTDEPIQYFYAPKYCTSKWHESQNFILEHGAHRFFAPW